MTARAAQRAAADSLDNLADSQDRAKAFEEAAEHKRSVGRIPGTRSSPPRVSQRRIAWISSCDKRQKVTRWQCRHTFGPVLTTRASEHTISTGIDDCSPSPGSQPYRHVRATFEVLIGSSPGQTSLHTDKPVYDHHSRRVFPDLVQTIPKQTRPNVAARLATRAENC